jgi:hypothetical protein
LFSYFSYKRIILDKYHKSGFIINMSDIFKVEQSDLHRLTKFFKESPRDFRYATAGVLNSLAFQTRRNDIQVLSGNMIIRNRRFLESNLKVEKTRAVSIDQQIAYAGSIERPGFSGWKEQQNGTTSEKQRSGTIHARSGNRAASMKAKSRMKSGNKFYKPTQYQGKDKRSRFQFMLRVIGSRGGGEFLLSENMPTKKGSMGKGLYELRQGKIKRLQSTENIKQPARFQWRSRSLDMLRDGDIAKIWNEQINRIVDRYKK